MHLGLDGHEGRPVDAAERLAEVGDPAAVEVALAVAVDVDADLDLPHELEQVDHGLAQAVPVADERVRRGGVHALGRVDRAVAVLVDAAAAGREGHRRFRPCVRPSACPSGPPPCPTTLIATVAIPSFAIVEAIASGEPCFESVKPCP